MKTYICEICRKKGIEIITNRFELRKHFKEEHLIKTEITNKLIQNHKEKRDGWIAEEIEVYQ